MTLTELEERTYSSGRLLGRGESTVLQDLSGRTGCPLKRRYQYVIAERAG